MNRRLCSACLQDLHGLLLEQDMLLVYDPVIVEVGKEPCFVLQPLVLRYLETQQRI